VILEIEELEIGGRLEIEHRLHLLRPNAWSKQQAKREGGEAAVHGDGIVLSTETSPGAEH
jgi:hypothetical protein